MLFIIIGCNLKETKSNWRYVMLNKKHVPELDKQHCPSSNNEKEQTNKLLLCDILVPSPDILTFIFSTGVPFLFFSCRQNREV